MSTFQLRTMRADEWTAVADLIYDSTNAWYEAHGQPPVFTGPKQNARLICEVYEWLDPGCCVVAEQLETQRLVGCGFYHPRATHVSLGTLNVHPDFFRQGVARRMLKYVTDVADQDDKPLRLVSSAANLDAFSLLNRAGFVPRMNFQQMTLAVPEEGLEIAAPGIDRVRPATLQDVPVMAALERDIHHIEREGDLRYLVENPNGIWHVSVIEAARGGIEGFLASVDHPGCSMLGPGVMRAEEEAAALILAELNQRRGRQPTWLIPSQSDWLAGMMYDWGAVNCALHVAQIRGPWQLPVGIAMPTFLPATG